MNSTVIENAAFPHILVGKGRKAIDITGPCLSESWEGPGRCPPLQSRDIGPAVGADDHKAVPLVGMVKREVSTPSLSSS